MMSAPDEQLGGTSQPGESDEERINRNLTELLGELRVAIPGVQVLFAFLLTVPFSQRFASVGPFERNVYLITLLLTAIASALLIAPSAYHRIEFRLGDRPHIVVVAHRLTLAGFAFLALAMTGAVLLITRYLFSVTTTIVVVSLVFLMFASLWGLLPLGRRRAVLRRSSREGSPSERRIG
jgi:small-conductance mechanosensitive channel